MTTAEIAAPPAPPFATSGLVVREASPSDRAAMAQIVALRRQVFGDEQRMHDGHFADNDDARSVQVLAAIGADAVGVGRLTPKAAGARPTEAQITWVATRAELRGRGIGEAVMRVLLAAADRAGIRLVTLSAQTHALGFYRRLGFVPEGHRFVVRGIEHQKMVRRTGR